MKILLIEIENLGGIRVDWGRGWLGIYILIYVEFEDVVF